MTLSQLRYFTAAAQAQSLSRAARLLHLSQPSLSKSISRLEEELGAPLFDRAGKRLLLNERGERFLESAQRILQEMDGAMSDLQLAGGRAATRLTAGLPGPNSLFTGCLADFAARHPGVEFDLSCDIESAEPPDINKFDMLLYPDHSAYRKFQGYFLTDERYFLAVPAHHHLAEKSAVSPADWDGQPFVLLTDGAALEQPYYLCAGLDVHMARRCVVSDREQHRQLVSAVVGLGFVPEGCREAYARDGGARLLPILNRRFSRRLMLCFKREKHLSPIGLEFRAHALSYFHLGGG